jgi:hypothetical protein
VKLAMSGVISTVMVSSWLGRFMAPSSVVHRSLQV